MIIFTGIGIGVVVALAFLGLCLVVRACAEYSDS